MIQHLGTLARIKKQKNITVFLKKGTQYIMLQQINVIHISHNVFIYSLLNTVVI